MSETPKPAPSAESNPKEATSLATTNGSSNPLIDPALEEPDTISIVKEATAAAVTHDRKKALLVKARAERRKWVQRVPLPYATPRDPDNIWSLEDRLYAVQSSLACKRIPAATKVLSELYGLESNTRPAEEVAQRVEALVRPFLTEGTLLEQDEELLAEAISRDGGDLVKSYHDFWTTMLKPESALLVQGMKNFLGNLEGSSMDRLSGALKSYLDSTLESLKSHVAWKHREPDDFVHIRRSLESFLYGHAQPLLDQVEWTGLFKISEEEWVDRLQKLQFVKPTHLEIQCLQTSMDIDTLLQAPIEAVHSIDQFYSPYEKLQRILAIYQGVNAALTEALAQDNSTERKLPSADDVLPTIILTVLRAKPKRLFRNLQLVEVFLPQEDLRGEAGYAYTNLYGAVHFLQELDMEKPDSLSISPEDFRKGLEESVSNAQKRLSIVGGDDIIASKDESFPLDVSVRDVRDARLRGEEVNLEWAKTWQTQNVDQIAGDPNEIDSSLPEGFTRTYTFLSANPQDIRMSDLPQLLSEYKTLVHATERLLGEKGARLASQKRRKDAEKSQQLDDSFFATSNSSPRERALTS